MVVLKIMVTQKVIVQYLKNMVVTQKVILVIFKPLNYASSWE